MPQDNIFIYCTSYFRHMGKTVLVLTSTFPRWKGDTTPSFVFELSNRLANKNRKMIVLAPGAPNASKKEKIENLEIHRFQYFPLPKLQKLAYGAGIIPNAKSSFLAKMQVPSFLASEFLSAKRLVNKYKPDILHAHWLIPQGILAVFLKKKYPRFLFFEIRQKLSSLLQKI